MAPRAARWELKSAERGPETALGDIAALAGACRGRNGAVIKALAALPVFSDLAGEEASLEACKASGATPKRGSKCAGLLFSPVRL